MAIGEQLAEDATTVVSGTEEDDIEVARLTGGDSRVITEGWLAEGEDMIEVTRDGLMELVELDDIEDKIALGRGKDEDRVAELSRPLEEVKAAEDG